MNNQLNTQYPVNPGRMVLPRAPRTDLQYGKYGIVFVMLVWLVLWGGVLQAAEEVTPAPRLLVLPFRLTLDTNASYSWLGRGLSYYLANGLYSNGFTVRQDNETAAMLETHAIFFPYNMTKATALRLAQDNKENILIWGDVGPDPKDKTRMLVSGWVIDLRDFTRKRMPTFRGHIQDIFLVLEALLKAVANQLKPGILEQPDFHFPNLGLNPRNYEIFIKSMLLTEPEKKIELLEKARATDTQSDYLNLHLARAYFDCQKYLQARTLLARVAAADSAEPGTRGEMMLKLKKRGLSALLDFAEGNTVAALDAFHALEKEKYELFEVRHNLAVIYYLRKEYGEAEKYFKKALDQRSDPGTWFYRVHNLLAAGNTAEAGTFLKLALRKYPDDNKLVSLFPYFLARSTQPEVLLALFQNYLPELVLANELPPLAMTLKTPFNVTLTKRYTDLGEFREIETNCSNGADETALERLGSLLEANPFMPKYYRLMAHLYLKKKEYSQAEHHALAAVFLEPSRESYLGLTVIYQAMGNRAKVKELEERMTHLSDTPH